MSNNSRLTVRVDRIRSEAESVRSFVLTHSSGSELPEYDPGSHIEIYLDNGLIRHYSLCGVPTDQKQYLIAVLRDQTSSGGSKYMHENVNEGDILEISYPRNHFRLSSAAERHLLIAGGIGVTPILSMTYALAELRKSFLLHYCAKHPEAMAFRKEFETLMHHGQIKLHFDGGNPKNGLNLNSELENYAEGTHLYYCGPAPMMKAAAQASSHWPQGTVHYEYFSADAIATDVADSGADQTGFQIKLSSSGKVYTVPPSMSIVEVLRQNGVHVDTFCEEGICGTCITRYLEGQPDHRDHILDDDDREQYLAVCCARSKSPLLVLDL